MGKPLEPDERQTIVDLVHEHGGSRSKVARLTKRSKQLVSRIAIEENIPSMDVHNTKKALEASNVAAEQRRIKAAAVILDVGIELIEGLKGRQPTPDTARSYKDAATGLAIGIDKDRLKAGEVTGRTENRKSVNLERLMGEERMKAWESESALGGLR